MTHSKDCLYHLEQSFLDCTCGDSNTTHTWESADLVRLVEEMPKRIAEMRADGRYQKYLDQFWEAVDELNAGRRISTPIPLTPSDEMVGACHRVYERFGQMGDLKTARISDQCMRAILSAALNLMGGKK